jgi:hypothetical protein
LAGLEVHGRQIGPDHVGAGGQFEVIDLVRQVGSRAVLGVVEAEPLVR